VAHTKSEYNFVLQDPVLAEQVIQSYLMANRFVRKEAEGISYYELNDPFIGKRGFEYYINEYSITIKAYIGTYKRCSKLEGFVGCAGKIPYKNSLDSLFRQLQNQNHNTYATGMNTAPQTNSNQGMQAPPPPQPDALNTFVAENNKNRETLTIVAFVISIVGFFISVFGMVYGLVIHFIVIYLAIMGLKTSKKGLAIATLVITGISILISILSLVAVALLY